MRQVTQRNGKETVKPACILMYNAGMGGVDLIDKKIYHIVAERGKNYAKLVRHCFTQQL